MLYPRYSSPPAPPCLPRWRSPSRWRSLPPDLDNTDPPTQCSYTTPLRVGLEIAAREVRYRCPGALGGRRRGQVPTSRPRTDQRAQWSRPMKSSADAATDVERRSDWRGAWIRCNAGLLVREQPMNAPSHRISLEQSASRFHDPSRKETADVPIESHASVSRPHH